MTAFLGYPTEQSLLGLGVEAHEMALDPDIVHMALLMLTSTMMCGVLLQTVTRIQAAEKIRDWVEIRNQWRINNGAIGARAPGPRAPGGPHILKKKL